MHMSKHIRTYASCALLFAIAFFAAIPAGTLGQESIALTITPPLFQIALSPGESWTSSIKAVNSNASGITFHASVVNFIPRGEEGHGDFIPLVEGGDTQGTLAEWIVLHNRSVAVPAGQSAEIRFSIVTPSDAPPGGHYAAILIGTEPQDVLKAGPKIGISSFVSSLIFLRVAGDVSEEGAIREFSSDKALYQSPEAEFALRFENSGNVHLRPQGDIAIYNMWGKERGKILINHETDFGNVLPRSTRRFGFEWRGEPNFFEVGRYKAVATLAYGEDSRKNVSRAVSFWVVPIKETVGVIAGFLFFGGAIIWFLRRYVKRALLLEMERRGMSEESARGRESQRAENILSPHAFIAPVLEGMVDLRHARKDSGVLRPRTSLLRKYALFFVFLPILAGAVFWLVSYLGEVLTEERTYEIRIDQGGQTKVMNAPTSSGR